MSGKNISVCTHPIWLLARTDSDLNKLYYGFFLAERNENNEIHVNDRVSAKKCDLEDIEAGLKLFLKEALEHSYEDSTSFGAFPVTTSLGARYFLSWARVDKKFIISNEDPKKIPLVLSALCEIPILPACGIKYRLLLGSGEATLDFTTAEQTNERDACMVALTLLSAHMMVAAWESLILEKKVLVKSTSPALAVACCDFLRRLVLPMPFVHAFIPLLPESIMSSIEAPFPYLIGVDADFLKNIAFDLANIVVIDLDHCNITIDNTKSTNPGVNPGAPNSLKQQLIDDISDLLVSPLTLWIERPCAPSEKKLPYPMSPEDLCRRASAIRQCFIRTNISLMCARKCTIRAFFRHPHGMELTARKPRLRRTFSETQGSSRPQSIESLEDLQTGFSRRNGKIVCGCLQLLKGKDSLGKQFTPCWVEMDSVMFAVYEYADELPLIYEFVHDIDSVSPSPIEPEGHVFELVMKSQVVYNFAATDTESRLLWIKAIEKRYEISEQINNNITLSLHTQQHHIPNAQQQQQQPLLSSQGQGQGQGSGNQWKQSQFQEEDLNEIALSEFRAQVMHTQMAAVLRAKFEFEEYEPIFSQLGIDTIPLIEPYQAPSDSPPNPNKPKPPPPPPEENIEDLVFDGNIISAPLGEGFNRYSAGMRMEVQNLIAEMGLTWSQEVSLEDSQDDTVLQFHESNSEVSGVGHTYDLPSSPDRRLKHAGVLGKGKNVIGGLFRRIKSDTAWSVSPQALGLDEIKFPQLKFSQSDGSTDTDSHVSGGKTGKDTASVAGTEANSAMKSTMESEQRRLRRRLGQVAAAHRRLEAQLSKRIVEDRMAVMQSLVDMYARDQQLTSSSSSSSPSPLSLLQTDSNKSDSCKEIMTIDLPILKLIDVYESDTNDGAGGSRNGCSISYSSIHSNWIQAFESNNSQLKSDTKEHPILSNHQGSSSLEADRTTVLIRRKLLSHLSIESKTCRDDPDRSHLVPVLQTLVGFLLMSEQGSASYDDQALYAFGEGSLVDQGRIMYCLARRFVKRYRGLSSKDPSDDGTGMSVNDVSEFMVWASKISPVVGLQALRLVTEITHRCLTRKVGLELAVGMTMERFEEMTSVDAMQSQTHSRHLAQVLGSPPADDAEDLTSFRRDLAHGNLSRRRGASFKSEAPTFSWIQSNVPPLGTVNTGQPVQTQRSDILNEVVHCTSASAPPCELSAHLLSKLREIIRAACESNNSNMAGVAQKHIKIRVQPTLFKAIQSSSAFKAFETQSCQLQKVGIAALTQDQRTLFFCNIFNTLMIHAIITRGLPGTSFYDRTSFMRNAKYNISGFLFSLLEIEHSILRAQSANPALVGYFLKSITFSDRDPRSAFVLSVPRPLISFCLYFACESSPLLTILRDVNALDNEMKKSAAVYFTSNVRVDKVTCTVTLPEIIRFYWKDFGGSNSKVVRTISSIVTTGDLALELKIILVDENKIKLKFSGFDWTPVLIV